MSGSGPEEPSPASEEDRQQEAEQDWAAAKAFYDNLVTLRPRPVSAGGPGVRSSGVWGEAGGPGGGWGPEGRGPALPCARSAAQAPERHHGGRVLPSSLQPGRGAADLRRAGRGEVRGVPAEKREHHPQARTGVLLRQGSQEAARSGWPGGAGEGVGCGGARRMLRGQISGRGGARSLLQRR